MTESTLIERERKLLDALVRLAAERAQAEDQAERDFAARNAAAEVEIERRREATRTQFESDKAATEREYRETQERIEQRFKDEHTQTEREFADALEMIRDEFESDSQAINKESHDTRWMITTVADGGKSEATEAFNLVKQRIKDGIHRMNAAFHEAKQLLKDWQQPAELAEAAVVVPPECPDTELLERFDECGPRADEQLARFKRLAAPKLFAGARQFWLFVACVVIVTAPAWWLVAQKYGVALTAQQPIIFGSAIGIAGGLALWAIVRGLVAMISKAQIRRAYQPLAQTIEDAKPLSKRVQEHATLQYQLVVTQVQQQYDRDVKSHDEKYARLLADRSSTRDAALADANERFPRRLKEITETRDRELRAANESFPRRLAEIQSRFDSDSRAAEAAHQRTLTESHLRHEFDWNAMADTWQRGLSAARDEIAAIRAESGALFLDWKGPAWQSWTPPVEIPPAERFGEFRVRLAELPNGDPTDPRLRPAVPLDFTLPSLLAFPEGCSMLFRAADAGRDKAIEAVQNVMLRLLTTIPPSKIRFTIIDPVGLGENFAAFMHLADHDEQLVTSRIWTEPQHIEQRLADLTGHMENVIQKYLRNEFPSITDYNVHAGEVAEPFRILVVANFPANFTESTARRLVSIASAGARCGVYTLVTVDSKKPLPHGFNVRDLEPHAVNLVWKDGRFDWKDAAFGRFPFKLDEPPDADFETRVLQIVGAKAKEASRVEVPFEFIAPRPDAWWSGDSRPGIDVALGRAGATKLQHLRLGSGTSQHVLIAGKTGSGKSTLLHALVTNLALNYSPTEVELYLVDFKKGVEFKDYATYALPHARVVAIESEREFGLSVLQRLDAELKSRGDRFRETGVQDIASYRNANGSLPCPRVLLIVDEFQEFFVEDDKISQEAALLLDRLVRQGRAFGIHVQLGSQTLGGAYALARSTMSQMAVRIALQCSESDAHLILSEDNPAARLLSRPGEAIYNDANGLVEGNNLFQVVWLPDYRREHYLREIRSLAARRHFEPASPQIVFEGNTPSDISKNHLLHGLIAAAAWPAAPKAAAAWLGEAIAIKDPTAAAFRAQTGANLLVVGQNELAALGIMVSSVVSLASQFALDKESGVGVQGSGDTSAIAGLFYLLDGTPPDSIHAGLLARLAEIVPQPIRAGAHRDVASILGEVAAEVDRRQKSAASGAPPVFLFIHDLQRFRELRRADDDFSFSRRGEEKVASPSKSLAMILREGPGLGVHTILWCDSLNNVNRALDRQSLKEFELRVLFQMGAADSSTLIDSPLAAKLGPHRALYHAEELGRQEKFRPYGLPESDWLKWVTERFRSRRT